MFLMDSFCVEGLQNLLNFLLSFVDLEMLAFVEQVMMIPDIKAMGFAEVEIE